MYKDRIRKWQVEKNIKGHEMKAIIRKQAQRSRAGKKSLFYLRNSQVPQHKVTRYRKAMQMLSEEQALMLRAETPPGLICHTPPASPLIMPEILEIPERIAKLVQDYVDGSFDSGTWSASESDIIMRTNTSDSFIIALQGYVDMVVIHFQRGETSNAWRLLRMAMSSIEHIVSAEHPTTLEILASILLRSIHCLDALGVASIILKQFSAMSALILPKQHPFNQIFARLLRLDISHLKSTIIVTEVSQSDRFSRRLGRFNWITLGTQLMLMEWKSMAGVARPTDSSLTLLQAMELGLDASEPRLLFMRAELAVHYLYEGSFIEAAKIAQSIIDLAIQNANVSTLTHAKALRILSIAQYQLLMTTLAEQNIRQAIHIRAKHSGWEGGKVLDYISLLEHWLEEWARPDEAAEVRRQRHKIIDSMEERITREEEERCQRLGITEA